MSARLVGPNANVLLSVFSGVHTASTLREHRSRLMLKIPDGVAAFVSDYRGCALTMDLADAAEMDTIGVIQLPGAFVVNAVQLPVVVRWAGRVADAGVIRQVFTELCPAVAWAELQADLGIGHFLG